MSVEGPTFFGKYLAPRGLDYVQEDEIVELGVVTEDGYGSQWFARCKNRRFDQKQANEIMNLYFMKPFKKWDGKKPKSKGKQLSLFSE